MQHRTWEQQGNRHRVSGVPGEPDASKWRTSGSEGRGWCSWLAKTWPLTLRNCGLLMDRDENSAVNIRERFLARLGPHTRRKRVRCIAGEPGGVAVTGTAQVAQVQESTRLNTF